MPQIGNAFWEGKTLKFSVLIPVYNVAQYLRESIDSVLNQTFSDYEVVLVDDGSTDESGTICDEYRSAYPERIKVIHKENQGLISARRIGIKNACGEFCVFVDSDDSLEADALETLAEYLRPDDEIDIVLFSFRYVRDGVKAERYPAAFADHTVWTGDTKRELYETLMFSTRITALVTKAIRTNVLRKDLIDYTAYYHRNMAEDFLQSLHPITLAKKVCYANKVLYNYRINPESISHSYTLNNAKKNCTLHVYNEILKCLPQWQMDSPDVIDQLNARWFHEAAYLFSKCYQNANSRKGKREIVDFDWGKMIPSFDRTANKYISQNYSALMSYQEKKKYLSIDLYFLKNKTYKSMRKVWRTLRGRSKSR